MAIISRGFKLFTGEICHSIGPKQIQKHDTRRINDFCLIRDARLLPGFARNQREGPRKELPILRGAKVDDRGQG